MMSIGELAIAVALLAGASAAVPESFPDCVIDGGQVSAHTGWLTCRQVVREDMRIYGEGLNDDGTPVPIEIWTTELTVSVTRALDPAGTDIRYLKPHDAPESNGG